MSQETKHTGMSADIFALENSLSLFETVGGLNDDQTAGFEDPNKEYGVDDMLTVIPGSPDTFGGQSIDPIQEPTKEEQQFVIDRFAEEMSKSHKTVVDKDAIDSLSPIIQTQVSKNMNVNQFLTEIMNSATQRLSSQNVSEAQPTGASPEEPIAAADNAENAPAPAVDPNGMGTPPMEPAPGGIAPEPSLDANVGDPAGAPADDLGLGAITDDGLDDFGAAPAPEDDLGLGAISDDGAAPEGDLGLDGITDDGASPDGGAAPEDDLGLGAITDDGAAPEGDGAAPEGDGAAPEGGAPAPAEGGDEGGSDDVLGKGSNLDSLSDDGMESGSDGDDGDDDDGMTDAEFEAQMAETQAILESIHEKFVEENSRAKVHTLVESFLKNTQTKKKVQLESQTAEFKKNAQLEAKAGEMRSDLGHKVAGMVEASKNAGAMHILESATAAFAKAAAKPAPAKQESISPSLKAQLESISKNYHDVMAKQKAAAKDQKAQKAQVEAASATPAAAPAAPAAPVAEPAPIVESAAAPKEKTLNEQLDELLQRVK